MLVDPFGRHINYLRVSVTDRCDMRCSYCMPVGFRGYEVPSHWLTFDESARLIRIFASLGVTKVRITGGEPLLRKGIVEFAEAYAANSGLEDISLSTNGSMLTRFAVPLRRAGVRRLNVSLDTMNSAKFAQITSRDVLPSVLSGLAAAKDAGFDQIKLNAVVQADVCDSEIEALLSYAVENGFVLRLIETMPMGQTGQRTSAANLTAVGARLAAKHSLFSTVGGDGGGPARYWSASTGQIRLGVITPMSQHFCEACNRVRLTVDGRLLLCLGHEDAVPLGRYMREGFSDAELLEAIRKAIQMKPERHHFREEPEKIVRFMSATGG
jgi:cyclic pyranopterin phosphate synthase